MRTKLFKLDHALLTKAMKSKIDRDKHKGSWENIAIADLFDMLKVEVKELENALKSEPKENIIKECADVANFAMMIAGNTGRKL